MNYTHNYSNVPTDGTQAQNSCYDVEMCAKRSLKYMEHEHTYDFYKLHRFGIFLAFPFHSVILESFNKNRIPKNLMMLMVLLTPCLRSCDCPRIHLSPFSPAGGGWASPAAACQISRRRVSAPPHCEAARAGSATLPSASAASNRAVQI